ncbi:hypothetical protein [Nodularia chucula]|uniref:hypothetical protein n=1 Tax=Nodularia chucula TaxID=3093667 RepID=UPI0039C705C6
MAGIVISELSFTNSESFFIEITDMYFISVYGGNEYVIDQAFYQMLKFTYTLMDFMLSAFAIYSITSLAQSFMNVYQFNFAPVQFVPF